MTSEQVGRTERERFGGDPNLMKKKAKSSRFPCENFRDKLAKPDSIGFPQLRKQQETNKLCTRLIQAEKKLW